ncbi:MAG: hypothetical protein ACRC8P_00445 [Spiroplasma sp.]
MTTALSILVSSSLAGFLFCLLKLIKINRIKKINSAEPVKNKKWRRFLFYIMGICVIFIILGITLFFTLPK